MATDTNPNTPSQVALWSAANANLLQSSLASAAIQAAKNSDGTPTFPNFSNTPIPFGSTINVSNPAPTAAGGSWLKRPWRLWRRWESGRARWVC